MYEHPPHPGIVELLVMVFPFVPRTSSCVLPVQVALGMPVAEQVEAARLLLGGKTTTQSTYDPSAESEKLVHCCSVVPVGSGPGGGGCGSAGGDGGGLLKPHDGPTMVYCA